MANKYDKGLILFIDDDKVIAEVTGKFLSSIGYHVAIAGNGAEGLELFDELRPQLVIADLCMPVMDGLQFLEETRKKRYCHADNRHYGISRYRNSYPGHSTRRV